MSHLNGLNWGKDVALMVAYVSQNSNIHHSSLAHRTRCQFFQKASETWTNLTTEYVSTVFLSVWDELVSRELPPSGYISGCNGVLSENGFPRSFWAHINILIMLAWRFLRQSCLRAWRSSSKGFFPWPLYNKISPDRTKFFANLHWEILFWSLLIILWLY